MLHKLKIDWKDMKNIELYKLIVRNIHKSVIKLILYKSHLCKVYTRFWFSLYVYIYIYI